METERVGLSLNRAKVALKILKKKASTDTENQSLNRAKVALKIKNTDLLPLFNLQFKSC